MIRSVSVIASPRMKLLVTVRKVNAEIQTLLSERMVAYVNNARCTLRVILSAM